jgi:hypothetical protein
LASIDCGHHYPDRLVRDGPQLSVIVGNRSATIPLNKQLIALFDTGSEWNLIENSIPAALHMMHIDDKWIRTANGLVLAPVYMGQLVISALTYTKLHRFIGVDIDADRVVLGRETLVDFILTYSGRSGKVTLEY